MFGKLKQTIQKGKFFLGKTLNKATKGSNWLGKTIDNIQHGYHDVKQFIQHSADKADKILGTEGAIRNIANRGVSVFEGNPITQAVAGGLDTLEVQNKLLRKNVLNNKKLRKFVNT